MAKSAGGAFFIRVGGGSKFHCPDLPTAGRCIPGRLILGGTLVAGQKLPSTRDLSRELGVSRITVKSVYEQLVAEGYAQAKTGSGTFIAEGLEFEAFPDTRSTSSTAEVIEFVPYSRALKIMSTKASIRHGETAPFRPGVPALDLFPFKLWQKFLLDAATSGERHNLSYGEAGTAVLPCASRSHATLRMPGACRWTPIRWL